MERLRITRGTELALNMCQNALKSTYGRKFKGWKFRDIDGLTRGNVIVGIDSRFELRKKNRVFYYFEGMVVLKKWWKETSSVMDVYCVVDYDEGGNPQPRAVAIFNRPFTMYEYYESRLFGRWLRRLRVRRLRGMWRRDEWLRSITAE